MPDRSLARLLGEFLKARRDRLAPSGVSVHRRRARGLRREEVAQSAEVSTSWYTWLEQGRAERPSAAVLTRVCAALQLNAFEERLVHALASGNRPVACRETRLTPAMHQVLELFNPCPAYVCNARRDLLAYNLATRKVFLDLDRVPARDRNLLYLLFTDRRLRNRMPNWERSARRAVATFRTTRMTFAPLEWFDELVERLTADSREFRVWWTDHDVRDSEPSQDVLEHPRVGRLVLNNTPLSRADMPGVAVVFVTPDEQSDSLHKLQRLDAVSLSSAR
jgi:transcriptional regulator with XRE-family HTH domain